MADDQHHDDFHLPSPSGVPIVVGAGIAIMLFGFVPDARLYRFALVSIGLMIAAGGGWRWLHDAIDEYRNLPD
ncbi:MAG: hypothetical protein ACTHNU_01200 [Gaiellales bacterium]|jgi:hypothetical protein